MRRQTLGQDAFLLRLPDLGIVQFYDRQVNIHAVPHASSANFGAERAAAQRQRGNNTSSAAVPRIRFQSMNHAAYDAGGEIAIPLFRSDTPSRFAVASTRKRRVRSVHE